jgi:rare lipoprotein A (peptidoglycan hydrolase)
MDFLTALLSALVITRTEIYEQPIQQESRQEDIVYEEDDGNTAIRDSQPVFRGYISSYNSSYGGCLGCQKYYDENGQLYYITASGDRLDDSKYHIASNQFPLGTRVTLTNLSNQHSISAVVDDTGGFERLGRIADVSPVVMQSLDARTDVDIIEIKEIPK